MSAIVLAKIPLAANLSFVQGLRDRLSEKPIGAIRGLVYTDRTGTLYLEESDNEGVNWSITATVAISAGVTAELPWTLLTKRWYRFRYVNGAAAQTAFRLVQQTRGIEESLTALTNLSEPVSVTGPVTVDQLKTALDINGTHAYRTMTLTSNPGSGQMLSFGDGSTSIQFDYVDDIGSYAGMNIPIQLGAGPEETQANTVTAYNGYEGPKPNVTISADGNILTITSGILGSSGNITVGPPATVGSAGPLVPGKNEVNLRNLVVGINPASKGVALTESIPAGNNHIGIVTVEGGVGGGGPGGSSAFTSQYPENATPFIVTATSAANAVGTATVTAAADKKHYVLGYLAAIRGAAAGSDILVTLKDGATTRLTDIIGNGAPSGTSAEKVSSLPVLVGTTNTNLVLEASAGGVGVISELTVWGYTL